MNQNSINTLGDVKSAVLKFIYKTRNGEIWATTFDSLCKVIKCDNENLVIAAFKLMADAKCFKIETYPYIKPIPRTYNPKQNKIKEFIRFPGGFHIIPTAQGWEQYEELSKKRLENMANKLQLRIHINDIDNLKKVCQVKPEMVMHLLDENGQLKNMKEDDIQIAFENILGVKHHKKDWGGEENDLCATVTVNGNHIAAAFMLKGKGTKKHILQISDCGKNGDQLVRLFQSPAELFVVQFVGEISENIIKDIEGKTIAKRNEGKQAQYCIINGQDTACILFAYNKIKLDQHV